MRVICLLIALAAACAQQPPTAPAAKTEPQPALQAIEDIPGLPRVLLIGDSISIGYTLPVRELLKGRANVHRIPANGATTARTLENLEQWLGQKKWDVIHANWGLHDLRIMEDGAHQVKLADYEKNLDQLARRLKQAATHVIFATTTPVPEGKVNPPRNPADVERYNEVAIRVMRRHGIPVVDLYTAVLPRLKDLQRPVNVHFTDEGSAFLAAQVAREISKFLPAGRQK
jgi:acyl-CoA thioesterase-1